MLRRNKLRDRKVEGTAVFQIMLPRRSLRNFAGSLCVATLLLCPANAQREMYPLKKGTVQPLHLDCLPAWVTFDMEIRGRLEEQTSLDSNYNKDRLYELTRVRGAVTVRPAEWLTGYMQFQDAHALGLPLRDVASNMRDVFDLRQGYVDLHYKPMHLVAGRQEFKFGDERVVGISDWTNTSRTWDGFDLHVGEKNRVDIFTSSEVVINPTSLDKHGAGLTFHGVEADLTALVPKTRLDPFVLVRTAPRVISKQGTAGSETEVSFGAYYETKLPLGFDSSGTGVLQRGSYSNNSIHSGAGILRAGYAAGRLPFKPHLEGEYDYATGDAHTVLSRIGTYDQQYPSNHNAFGLVDLFGFQNIKQDRLSFSLAPQTNFLLLFQTGSLHVATRQDGVYNGAGKSLVKAPTGGFLQDGIGTEFDASAKYIFRKSFVTNVGVGHLFPGYVMTNSQHGAPLTLVYLQLTYRFKVDR